MDIDEPNVQTMHTSYYNLPLSSAGQLSFMKCTDLRERREGKCFSEVQVC
uniref:Uncharacterized protein n=1 Tax=Arundo donax TaxID=35708 RepID=A0A0A9EJ53_ARUDO